MRALVTGGTGFVGSHVAARLLRDGHAVRLLVRDPRKAESVFRGRGLTVPELVPGDVRDGASVHAALSGCDAAVHAAAITPLHAGAAEDLAAVNVDGTRAVIGGACELGIPALYVSSITAIFHTDSSKMTDDAPVVRSTHPYGRSKASAETAVRALQVRGAPVTTIYPGGVIGPDDPGLSVSAAALRYRVTDRFRLTSSGIQLVDVRDLAAAIVALVGHARGPGRHLAAGHFLTWGEAADLLERVSGCRLKRVRAPGWYLRALGRAADLARRLRPVAAPISAETMMYATRWPRIRNSRSLEDLGVRFRDPSETYRDTLLWMCRAGYLDPGVVPRLADAAVVGR